MKKEFKDLNLCDDFLFGQVMSDPDICKPVLEKLLGISIKSLENLTVEKEISPLYDKRGIRLDVTVNDANGTIYTIEMQNYHEQHLGKRFRYYQALTDANSIFKGESYDSLHETFIIFICTYDPFGLGKYFYRFDTKCHDEVSDLTLEDEAHKIVISTDGHIGDIDDEMRIFIKLIKDCNNAEVRDSRLPLIDQILDKISRIKQNHELGADFLKYRIEMDRIEKKGKAEGKIEGRTEKQFEIAAKMLEKGSDLEFISECTGLSEEEIIQLTKQ